MTRPDQTRPDQTRPDHDLKHALKSLKEFLKRHDRFHILRRIAHPIYYFLWGRDRTFFHPFSKKTYSKIPYIIRRKSPDVGLFSYFNTILGGIAYADENGYIPVVDMKNYPNTYLFPDEVGRINSWEYYFEQPGGISLEEAMSSRKYILGRDTSLHNRSQTIDYKRSLFKKYIRFTQPVLERVEAMKQKFYGMRLLGVHIRGTDIATGKFKNHSIQPTAKQAISKVREVMKDEKFDAIYLSTEDKNIVSEFLSAFGEKLLLPEAQYVDYDGSGEPIDNFHVDRENYKYLSGLDYVVSIIFLSTCKGLLVSGSNGSGAALLFSDSFEYLYVFDLGVY